MNNIVLKAKGVKQINRNELLTIDIPVATESYCPISNREIVETALECLDREGLRVNTEFHKTDGSNQKFVGGFIVNSGNSEMNMMFGYKNSYDRSMSAAYALGAQIFICSNSAVNGDEMLMRKHTGKANEDIKHSISEGIKRMGDNFRKIETDFTRLKEIEVSKKVCAELIGDLYIRESLITSHQLSLIKQIQNDECEDYTYNYGVEGTAYNLYQDLSHVLKTSHPTKYISNHANLHNYFINEFGILLNKEEEILSVNQENYLEPIYIN